MELQLLRRNVLVQAACFEELPEATDAVLQTLLLPHPVELLLGDDSHTTVCTPAVRRCQPRPSRGIRSMEQVL